MAEQFANQCSTFLIGGYTAGSGFINVGSTGAPWPQIPTFTIQLQNAAMTLLRVTAVNSATQWAVTAESNDLSTNGGTTVLGTVLSAAAFANILSGMILLETHTASNSTAIQFTTRNIGSYLGASFQTDFSVYQIEVVGLLPSTNNVDFNMLFSSNGGSSFDSTTGHYSWTTERWTAGAGGQGGGINSADNFCLTGGFTVVPNTASLGGVCGSMKIFSPCSGNNVLVRASMMYNDTSVGYQTPFEMGGAYVQTTAVNAFQIVSTSGNIASGTVRLYGIS